MMQTAHLESTKTLPHTYLMFVSLPCWTWHNAQTAKLPVCLHSFGAQDEMPQMNWTWNASECHAFRHASVDSTCKELTRRPTRRRSWQISRTDIVSFLSNLRLFYRFSKYGEILREDRFWIQPNMKLIQTGYEWHMQTCGLTWVLNNV